MECNMPATCSRTPYASRFDWIRVLLGWLHVLAWLADSAPVCVMGRGSVLGTCDRVLAVKI